MLSSYEKENMQEVAVLMFLCSKCHEVSVRVKSAKIEPVSLSNGISLNVVLSASRDGLMIGNEGK